MTKAGGRIGTMVLFVLLLGLLAVSVWFAAQAWTVEGPPLPTQGYIAMTLGVVFSVVIGCGLMALVFFSNRYGYDERSNRDQHRGDDDRATHP
ncbi:MAG TPA: hypothetical protein VMA30_06505 [Xanthobacteraceae bacterium]|nr:hypothetical protein [Xanthobacteraceae bacterium]